MANNNLTAHVESKPADGITASAVRSHSMAYADKTQQNAAPIEDKPCTSKNELEAAGEIARLCAAATLVFLTNNLPPAAWKQVMVANGTIVSPGELSTGLTG